MTIYLSRTTYRSTPVRALMSMVALTTLSSGTIHAQTPDSAGATPDALATIKTETERQRGLFPSQSHGMMDVSYHFTNLWFAGQHENWPLAQFYLGETRNHIKWAIRLVPVRKTSTGPLMLTEVFDGFNNVKLAAIEAQIAAKNRKQFSVAYREALGGCNDCHERADKPYLHMIVPKQPESRGIDFDPQPSKKE